MYTTDVMNVINAMSALDIFLLDVIEASDRALVRVPVVQFYHV